MLTVDYLLGDNRNRYFGRGHKRTTYEVKLKNILEGVGSLHQEGLWSSKQSEIVQQHLSTLDGIVLAHLFGSEILKRMGVNLNQYRLSHFEIKSGIKAIEELVNLRLELQNFKMTNQVIEFDCLVMDMKVCLGYQLLECMENVVAIGEQGRDFLSTHLRDRQHDIYDVEFSDSSISCKAEQVLIKDIEYSGVGSLEQNYYSLLELLIIFSQMAEMLAYHIEEISREESNTMWMKQVSADLDSPILNGVVELSGSVSKNRLLKIREEHWKVYEMSGYDVDHKVVFKSKIAQKLPDGGGQ